MKIIIADRDRTEEWGPALRAEADRRMADPVHVALPPALQAQSLRQAGREAVFLDQWTDLVRRKCHVDTLKFDIARSPGTVGGLLQRARQVLWRVLRYQHDRVISRQNQVNSYLLAAVEFQNEEIRRLRAQVETLERRSEAP